MRNLCKQFIPGDRVIVFDPSLYVDDKKTPLGMTFKLATVVCHYGLSKEYPSLIDVVFDHNQRLSKGHFTVGVKVIN